MVLATVVFGNNNSYDITLPSTLKLGHLINVVGVIINKKPEDILHIICNGDIVSEFDDTFDDLGLVRDKCCIHLIFKDQSRIYPDAELVTCTRNLKWAAKNSIQQNRSGGGAAGAATGGAIAQFMNALGMNINLENLEDVAITLTDDQFEETVEPVTQQPVDSCAICRGVPSVEDGVTLPCNHVFHRQCIREWLTERSIRCPTCNADVREN